MDSLRVWAMLMVFYYHCALFVNPVDMYGDNKGSSLGFMVFLAFAHMVIMPFFFLIAGASARFALDVTTNGQYIYRRFQRLMVPYIAGAFTLIPLHKYFLDLYNSRNNGSFWEYYLYHFRTLSFKPDPTVFAGIGEHLWFLSFLFIFSLVTLPVFLSLRKGRAQHLVSTLAALCEKPGAFLLFVAPVIAIQAALKVRFPGYRNWADFFYWLVFFVYGYMIVSDKRLVHAIAKQGITSLVIGLASFAGIVISLLDGRLLPWLFNPEYSPGYVLFLILSSLDTWCWIVFFLFIGTRFLNFSNSFLKYCSEEVLPFYILHLTVILFIGSYAVHWSASKSVHFLAVSTMALITTVAINALFVRRIKALRFLFGMKPVK